MLVKMGYADALLGGATYSTADTVPQISGIFPG
jgi:phosphotransacetylase